MKKGITNWATTSALAWKKYPTTLMQAIQGLIQSDSPAWLVVHPARKQTISQAEFPHGFVVVLDGRQPACVLRLATRKFRSDLWSAF